MGILIMGYRYTERFYWQRMKRQPACLAMNLKLKATVLSIEVEPAQTVTIMVGYSTTRYTQTLHIFFYPGPEITFKI